MTYEKINDALDRAGAALLHAAKLQAQLGPKNTLNNQGYRARLVAARSHLELANPVSEPHKFLATKTALETLEAFERGNSTLGGIEIFKALVESIHGGEREMDFGGRRRQGRKFDVNTQYLRAAAVALWEEFPAHRGQLVSHARQLIGVGSKDKLEKIVEKFNELHDVDVEKSGSALSVHMPVVKDLIQHHGYRELRDFA